MSNEEHNPCNGQLPSHQSGDLIMIHAYGNTGPKPGWTRLRQPWWRRFGRWVTRRPSYAVYYRSQP